MANEATVRNNLRIRKGNLIYSSGNASFRANVSDDKGPTPGYLSVTTAGENVSFSELTTPGLVRIKNLDETNYVEYGIHDGSLFHPVGEILPGEEYIFRLSRNLGEELNVSPGTGSTAVVNTFFLQANGGTCGVIVDAFEA